MLGGGGNVTFGVYWVPAISVVSVLHSGPL